MARSGAYHSLKRLIVGRNWHATCTVLSGSIPVMTPGRPGEKGSFVKKNPAK
jgi:hypothetical protein